MSNFGSKLQTYAQGTEICQHPINKVDDNYFCHACNTQLIRKIGVDKDAVIAARDETIRVQAEQIERLKDALQNVLDEFVGERTAANCQGGEVADEARALLAELK